VWLAALSAAPPAIAGVGALALPPTPLAAQQPQDQRAPAGTAVVRGRVVDRDGGAPVNVAQVSVVGQRVGASTNATGEFIIRGVAPGTLTIRVARIGYSPTSQTVTVAQDATVTLTLTLARAAAQLEQVVTTASGERTRREYGNVVAVIAADSIKKTQPVTTVNELLQARTPGLQVIQGSGQTGASSSIRIRGQSSLSLTNEPLIIVDGVRYDNSPVSGNFSTQRVNRFSDFNPEEIESVEVLKGPSAASLYGTAAANGVIVIKTKRGRASARPQWTLFGEGGLVQQPAEWETNWRSWGRNLNAQGQPVGGPILCRISAAANRQCTVDSVTSFNPFENRASAYLADGPRSNLGVQVSGGSEQLRYFFAVTRQDETGPYQMPDSEITRLTAERGRRPTDLQIRPNQLDQTNLRGNFGFALARNAQLDVSTSYSDRTLYTPFDGGFFAGLTFQMMTAPGFRTATNGTQREFVGDIMSIEQKLAQQRFVGSASLAYTPLPWLQARAVVGLDQANSYNRRMQRFGEGPRVGLAWGPRGQEGGIDNDRSDNRRYSVDLGATATWNATQAIVSKTTVGAQWFRDGLYQAQGQGYGFAPGVITPNSASQRQSWEFTTENATYGAFLEQQVGWRDRLIGAVGVRTDQNSAFGRNVGNTVYPRASLSYVISEEPWFPETNLLNRMRLRSAWGRAGVQPGTIAALQFLGAVTVPLGGAEAPALRIASIGNEALRPEVTTELEMGFDAGLLNDRVNVEATLFNKISRDALFQRPLPPSYGAGANQWQNLAKVQNRGVELSVDFGLLRTKPFSWDVRANGSRIVNRLVDAGGAPLPAPVGARNVVGYPLFGLWERPILSYEDRNGDRVLVESEITVGTADAFRGSTIPVLEGGLTNIFGLFDGAIRVSTLFDYRGQFYNQWGYQNQRCVATGNCEAVNNPGAPFDEQAAAVMANSSTNRTQWGFFVPNDFVRFRELSVSYNLPTAFARRARASSASLVLSGRNLGVLWTKFPGIDPEANSAVANTGGGNNDFFSPPVLRYWIARVNLSF
jgi:TonB-linked SusC/RagA family outer membrane protein